jgi:ferredoxin
MTYVVGEKCIKCKYTDCVEVCPVDCFHEGANMLVIDPEECIDCGVCVPECPIDAIFDEEDLPEDQRHFLAVNAEYARRWPVITKMRPPPDDARQWEEVPGKYPAHFSPEPGTSDEPCDSGA